MESRIARLEEVEEPRKEWALQFTHRQRPALQLGRRHARRGHGRASAASRSARPRCRSARGTGSASPARTAPARRRCCGCCSAGSPPTPGGPAWAPRSRSARSTRPAPGWPRTSRWATRSRPPCPTWPRPTYAPCWRSSGSRPTRSPAWSARLSPGERTRAAMALLQARGVNLLVLDEPTNHLDLPAIEQLEEALESYDGAAAARHPRPAAARQRPARPALARRGRPGHHRTRRLTRGAVSR